jgi:ABC-type branched-subunit amino acid transport system substrate-binding protein
MERTDFVDWIQEDIKSNFVSLQENFTALLRRESTMDGWNEFCDIAMSFVNKSIGKEESFDENSTRRSINIAFLLGGEEDFNQMKDITNFTVSLINNRTSSEEWDILGNTTTIHYRIQNSRCNETSSFDAYWKIREEWKGDIQAVIGPTCSADAVGLGWLTTVERKVQVLHVASSRRLSDKNEFPFVSRLVAPDSSSGEVGAMGEMLRGFGWDRVSILSTDSLYANDYVNEFKKLNKPFTIPLSEVITYDENGLDENSIRSSLKRINDLDWAMRSKVVLLVADIGEAKMILTYANEAQLSSDTIWVGSSKWCRFEFWKDLNFTLPENPGYFGIIPFTNRGKISDYINKLQHWLGKKGNETELPNYSAEYLVDSILAVALAFNSTPYKDWSNASLVTDTMRNLSFEGLSGNVSFTKEGDRENPKYSIINLQRKSDGTLHWEWIGDVKTTQNSTNFDSSKKICFPGEFGCNNKQMFPSETYNLPINRNLYFLAIILVLLLLLVIMIWRNDKKQKSLQVEMSNLQERKKEIDEKLDELDTNLENEMTRRIALMRSRGEFVMKPETWTNSNDNIIVEVLSHEQQYWDVTMQLQESMKNAYISKLWRIQNKSLWDYYSFHKDRLAKNNIPPNEKNVWHGTSNLDPAIIYCDPQDGFMIQYSSKKSLWG